jgi:hypothetical protein
MPSDRRPLRDLAVALLNATLLLIVAALILAVTLVVQLRGLATDLREGLRSELTALQPQLQAARDQARAALDANPAPQVRAELESLLARLETLDPATLQSPQTESLLRQIVLAIFTTAAQGLTAP